VQLLGQYLLFEAAFKMHDGVKRQRSANYYCHGLSNLLKKFKGKKARL
jgi:hypothetical protein